MPIRGERGAPTFDQKQPNDLARYFRNLEALFDRCKVADEIEKKRYAVSYVDSNVADSWEALPEYTDAAKNYEDFKNRLYEIYNQSSHRYILSDLDRLIGERQRLGMRSLNDLSDFHLRFNAISSYLQTSGLISPREQSQAYLRVFDESLLSKVLMRLQIKYPNHHPSLPYSMDEIFEAAKWVLQGVSGTSIVSSALVTPQATANRNQETPTKADQEYIKTEQLGSILNEFTKSIVEAIRGSKSAPKADFPGTQSNRGTKCIFDGCDKFIRDCELVEEYIRAGKCRRNHEGKLILPGGGFVPRDIPGQYLRDRIDEYHKRNPGQLARGTLSSGTGALFNAVMPEQTSIPKMTPNTSSLTFQLSAQDRIAALEAELFNLRVRHQPGFVPTIKTRRQRAAEQASEEEAPVMPKETPQQGNKAGPTSSIPGRGKTPEQPSNDVNEKTSTSAPSNETAQHADRAGSKIPEHPYRRAQDASYAPPQNRNLGVPEKTDHVPPTRKGDPAYRTLPAIHDPKIASSVYSRALDTPITITYHELLSLSPEVRSQIREATTSKRISTKDTTTTKSTATLNEGIILESLAEQDLVGVLEDESVYIGEKDLWADLVANPTSIMQYTIPTQGNKTPPPGSIIVPDHFEQYYRNLRPGEAPDPDKLVVAMESTALRSIVPLVDNHLKVESILDPGCQIIAMSEEVCHELALPYDPTIVLNMQSANGTIDRSLGLARNVPFLLGDLALYMQVHVIRRPAYDILLGRPFDVLTQSIVRNFRNEDQTITLHDPNSDKVITIPSISRGAPRFTAKCEHRQQEGFRR